MRSGFITKKLGVGRRQRGEAAAPQSVRRIEGGGFTWLDLQNPDRGRVERLAKEYGLNALNVEDCLTKFELPKLDSYDDHVFMILHFPPLASKGSLPRHSQLSIFMGREFVITVHQGDLEPLVDLARDCEGDGGAERRNRILGGSTGVLLHEIVDILVDDLLHTMRRIVASIDDVEEGAFDERRSVARRISLLRREITMVRRTVNPLKRIIEGAARHAARFSPSEDLTLYFDDVIDHVDKVVESLGEAVETLEIYKDTDFMLSSEKTNKVLAVLTVIFTLAIPATVVGTFYGMNVNLPGAGEEPGTYAAFTGAVLASVIPAALMFAYFRRLGWMSN